MVTHEVPSGSSRKIKIPDICIGIEIKCMTPYEMPRRESARFVLGKYRMADNEKCKELDPFESQ